MIHDRYPWLLDQEIAGRHALLDQRSKPSRLAATAGPGFARVGRIAIFWNHLAQLTALGAFPAFCFLWLVCRRCRGEGIQLIYRVTMIFDVFVDLGSHGSSFGSSQHFGLLLFCLSDQGFEFFGRQAADIDGHLFDPSGEGFRVIPNGIRCEGSQASPSSPSEFGKAQATAADLTGRTCLGRSVVSRTVPSGRSAIPPAARSGSEGQFASFARVPASCGSRRHGALAPFC